MPTHPENSTIPKNFKAPISGTNIKHKVKHKIAPKIPQISYTLLFIYIVNVIFNAWVQ